jgi:zinc protease
VVTQADEDSAMLAAAGVERNLVPTLDVWTQILLQPDFPQADWEINRKQRIADLAAMREDPTSISLRVYLKTLYGESYRGRMATEASYAAIGTGDMRAFVDRHFGPENAIVFVGGSLDVDEIVPLLEARLGTWKPTAVVSPEPEVVLPTLATPVLYLVDKPGAAQSVVRVVGRAGSRLDPSHYALRIGNQAWGGTFTGRVNMNLREDKGYTYNARCAFAYRYGPGLLSCSTSVRTDATAASIREIQAEIARVRSAEPLTDDEIGFYRGSEIHGYPGQFEVTQAILGQQAEIWLYDLPSDWMERTVPGIQAVTTPAANAALQGVLVPEDLLWFVVGDKAVIGPELQTVGLRIVELDRDGRPVTPDAP